MRNLIIIIGILALLGGAYMLGRESVPEPVISHEIRIDTVEVPIPVLDTVYATKEVVRYLPSIDTLQVTDTLYKDKLIPVLVPMKTYVFKEEGMYEASMVGYDVHDFKMTLYNRTEIIETIHTEKKQPRLSLGIQVGYAGTMSTKGMVFGPTIGVGIQYNLINFNYK